MIYSEKFACPEHPEASLEELSPRLFSFNSPYGACKSCDGLGTILEFDPDLIVPDKSVSLENGAIDAWRHGGKRMNIFYNRLVQRFCRLVGHRPRPCRTKRSPKELKQILLYGTTDEDREKYGVTFEGVIPNLTRRWKNTTSEYVKARLHGYLVRAAVPDVQGRAAAAGGDGGDGRRQEHQRGERDQHRRRTELLRHA